MKSFGRLLLSSVAGLVCEKLVGAIASVASNHLFTSVYGARLFGELQFALSLAYVVGGVAMVFSSDAVAPILGKHPRLRHLVLYRAFRLRLVSTLVVMLVFVSLAWALMTQASADFTLVAAMLLIAEPLSLGGLMAYSEKRPWVVTRAKTLASSARVLWLLATAHLSAGAVIASFAWPIEGFIATAGPLSRYFKLAFRAPKSFLGDETLTRAIVTRGVKFWPAMAVSMLTVKLDRILLAALMSKTDLGIYSAAAALVEQWNWVGVALALALAPSMVFGARNETELRAKALKLSFSLGLLATFGFIGSVAIGREAFLKIYGASFEAGAPVMIFATGCSIVTFADAGLSTWLIAGRRYLLILIKQGLTVAAIAASPFLVPQEAIMFAPPAATALAIVLFWCGVYGWPLTRASKLPSLPTPNSRPESNG
ncbi:lipopolysaccharide biosynthesis protein [Trinickia mobilis]|uniref:lipopolysaccharide biosynthesis protein n=1 Tax=Trinickia mobilis TaxID=2816356 RepID=UPI001A8FE975|nr:hypothetical protein [Trinickia mobilis]